MAAPDQHETRSAAPLEGTADSLEQALSRARTRAYVTATQPLSVPFRHWEVERSLGRGGMGGVFLARNPSLDRPVALKLLGATAPSGRRMRTEARALAKIRHPNVVAVHSVDLDGVSPVIEMDYVDGITLGQWVRTTPPVRTIVEAYAAAGVGIAAIHAAGLVHRDIKPDNILRTTSGEVVVVDLGLATDDVSDATATESARDASPRRSHTAAAGTPGYMAPEVLLGRPPTSAVDQFSLACSLCEAVYGELPFAGFADEQTYLDAVRRGPAPTQGAGASPPRWLRRSLRRALEFDPAHRYPSVETFVAELRHGLGQRRRWWQYGGFSTLVVVVGSLSWAGGSKGPPCPSADAWVEPRWSQRPLDPLRARVDTLRSEAGPRALALVEAALDRTQTRWAREQVSECRAQATGVDTFARAQCLDDVESAVRGQVEAARADEHDLLGRLVEAAGEIDRLPACPPSLDAVPRTPLWLRPQEQQLRRRLTEAQRADTSGHYAAAERALRKILDHATALPRLQARARFQLGHVLGSQDRSVAASAALDQARAAAFATGDDPLLCDILVYQAKVWSSIANEPERAARDLGLAAACLQRTRDPSPLVWADLHDAQGLHAHAAGRPPDAIAAYELALQRRIEAVGPDHFETGKSLHNLGNAWARMERWAKAQELLERALRVRTRVLGEEHPRVANTLFDLGDVLRNAGHPRQARARLQQALRIYSRAGIPTMSAAPAHLGLAQVALDTQAWDEAQRQLDACAELQHQPPRNAAELLAVANRLHTQGVVHIHGGDFESARVVFARATELLRRHDGRAPAVHDSTLRELEMLYGLERFGPLVDRVDREDPWLAQHIETLSPSERGRFTWYIAEAAEHEERPAIAERFFRRALAAYTTLDDTVSMQALHGRLALTLAQTPQGQTEAREHALACLAIVGGPDALRRSISQWLQTHPPPKGPP